MRGNLTRIINVTNALVHDLIAGELVQRNLNNNMYSKGFDVFFPLGLPFACIHTPKTAKGIFTDEDKTLWSAVNGVYIR